LTHFLGLLIETSFSIASSICNCDRLVVFERGRLVFFPTLRKKREGWGTHHLWQGKMDKVKTIARGRRKLRLLAVRAS